MVDQEREPICGIPADKNLSGRNAQIEEEATTQPVTTAESATNPKKQADKKPTQPKEKYTPPVRPSEWIEQRVQEEQDVKGETGSSLREIGRVVAMEVEKHFETKVNPTTIFSKARRMQADSNESPTENNGETVSSTKLEKLEKPQHGGARDGSGRKSQDSKEKEPTVKQPPKPRKPAVEDERVTDSHAQELTPVGGTV